MENKKGNGNGIFLSVIGVATLIVAIIGATFAYFSASAVSNNDAVRVESTTLTLGYSDDPSGLNTDLIPAAERYALYAGTNQDWINKVTEGSKGLCLDQNGNEICSTYKFTIGNPSFGTTMDITGKVTVTVNEFANLMFAIYDEKNVQVVAPKAFPTETGGEVKLTELDQTLQASSLDSSNTSFKEDDPDTYTAVYVGDETTIASNKRTYTMVIWIEEAGTDQTKVDAGKIFTAGLTFDTGTGKGVTGLIAAADATNP